MVQSPSFMSGVPELLVMRLLARKEMYGYELARAIREVTREAISVGEGVLYPALHTLETRGLLRGRRQTASGRTRVYLGRPAFSPPDSALQRSGPLSGPSSSALSAH